MAITPRSKGLGNIGAIVDRQGRASPAMKAPVKPVVKAAPKPAARVAPKPAPKMAPAPKPSPFKNQQQPIREGTGQLPPGFGAPSPIDRSQLGGAQRVGGPVDKPIIGGPPKPQPGAPIDYLAELNKDASWGVGIGDGNFTPSKRMDDASENYFKSVIDAAGGYDQYKAKNPGKDVFTINEDFQRLNPEQKYGYLSYVSPDDSPSNRPPVSTTPPPKSIYDQFGIPPMAYTPDGTGPYMPPEPPNDMSPPGYQYNGPPPNDPSRGGPQMIGGAYGQPIYGGRPNPMPYEPYDMPQTAPDFTNYDNLPPVPMAFTPDGGMNSNPYMPPEPPPGYDYGGPYMPRPNIGPGVGFGVGLPQPGQDLGNFYPGEPAPYTGGMMSPRRVINQVGKPGFQPRPTMQSAFSPDSNNFGDGGFMGGSGSMFGGGGFAGK